MLLGAERWHRAHRLDHILVQPGTSTDRSAGLQIRDMQPSCGPPRVDQLLGCKARTYAQVGKVPLDGARSNAHQLGRIVDRSTSGNECRVDRREIDRYRREVQGRRASKKSG